ncbi:very short patch repair endonuclease [Thioalkalivibrio sp. ALMg3]|uniref:very short patch repair endonuclease n=1 Tax=Thioalkalivibrio sp. ALMg3 TaxID=1158163 RepID=UPI00037DCF33|nr:very short patch repair endonuclease [Thioalkalivibrio sp. ALMg3]
MDVVDRDTRSRMMSGIRSRNTRPELRVRRFLHSRGFRFRLHARGLPGKPDLVMKKHNLAIFVHGCFWHRHPGCQLATTPATNAGRWQRKFAANVERDERTRLALRASGWRVLVLWECGLKGRDIEQNLAWLPAWIRSEEGFCEWPAPASRAHSTD